MSLADLQENLKNVIISYDHSVKRIYKNFAISISHLNNMVFAVAALQTKSQIHKVNLSHFEFLETEKILNNKGVAKILYFLFKINTLIISLIAVFFIKNYF